MAKYSKILSLVMRFVAMAASVAAVVVIVTTHDTAHVLNLTFTAKYNNTPAFVYFMIVEAIAGLYSLITLILSTKNWFGRIVIILDVVMTVLLASSISAALAIGDVGKKGNDDAGWLPICGQVPKFCDHVTGALIAGVASAILYFTILLYSLYTVLDPILM
ncbi:CASP-like protein 1C2 [Cannabis sativa]|uniref:CASP-like protein 1C2 n=1 Tax=Cannabis sativa TaxID=3483 RepID=UPI0029CA0BF1|nr:CASP-like protein 1C2 [Cannabis sativa]